MNESVSGVESLMSSSVCSCPLPPPGSSPGELALLGRSMGSLGQQLAGSWNQPSCLAAGSHALPGNHS